MDWQNVPVIKRFLRYVSIDTQSSEESTTHPSTEKQKDLGRLLYKELVDLGAEEVWFDENANYVYASIPATDGGREEGVLGFIAHMDTAPDLSGKNVKPSFVENYDGEDIVLRDEADGRVVLSPRLFPELKNYVGKTLITTDGTTLLGADDKAGIAEIMTMAEILCKDAKKPEPLLIHGKIAVAFTCDEEIGAGVVGFDKKRFGADYGFTVDGGAIGEIEYENFNAAAATVTVKGINVHPGEARGKMLNAISVAIEYDNSLPLFERPERTAGYEGFYHAIEFSGTVEQAKLRYIIRDHDRKQFENRKKTLLDMANSLNYRYGEGTITVELKDQYYNMKEKIDPDYLFLIEDAKECMSAEGIHPRVCPIRGGTDGATLSYRGLPCPNLCTGGHNFHGRYEYICAESMVSITNILVRLCQTVKKKQEK